MDMDMENVRLEESIGEKKNKKNEKKEKNSIIIDKIIFVMM